MNEFFALLRKEYHITEKISLSVMDLIIMTLVLLAATIIMRMILKLLSRNLPYDDKRKFKVVFGYARWFVYVIIVLITFHSLGIPVTGVFAASAALLIGIGLALQTLFQDIISGVFILIDQSVHVGDIIEIEGKVGRVEEIKLRTTRAVTMDNKILIIPNHLYLENSLYNWTQNGTMTRENVKVGVAYGSDVQLVKKLLLEAAKSQPEVLDRPEATVLFTDFGDSSLNFSVAFTINDSFNARFPQSAIRFEIDRLFREHNIKIPFPQRDIHIIESNSPKTQ
jgi:small-conductance mechanosensitive channel